MTSEQNIVVSLSGRGDEDVNTVGSALANHYSQSRIRTSKMIGMARTVCLFCVFLGVPAITGLSNGKVKPSTNIPSRLMRVLLVELCSNGCSEEEKQNWRENVYCELLHLNNDDVPEYFVSIRHPDWCGAGSNCTVWVYQRRGRAFRLLASEKGLRPHKTYTKGYRDLYGDVKIGASQARGKFEYSRTVYKFNGRKYAHYSEKYVQR